MYQAFSKKGTPFKEGHYSRWDTFYGNMVVEILNSGQTYVKSVVKSCSGDSNGSLYVFTDNDAIKNDL